MKVAVREHLTAEELEAKVRRLMAQRAGLRLTWETRTEREFLLAQIVALLDRHGQAR